MSSKNIQIISTYKLQRTIECSVSVMVHVCQCCWTKVVENISVHYKDLVPASSRPAFEALKNSAWKYARQTAPNYFFRLQAAKLAFSDDISKLKFSDDTAAWSNYKYAYVTPQCNALFDWTRWRWGAVMSGFLLHQIRELFGFIEKNTRFCLNVVSKSLWLQKGSYDTGGYHCNSWGYHIGWSGSTTGSNVRMQNTSSLEIKHSVPYSFCFGSITWFRAIKYTVKQNSDWLLFHEDLYPLH